MCKKIFSNFLESNFGIPIVEAGAVNIEPGKQRPDDLVAPRQTLTLAKTHIKGYATQQILATAKHIYM